MKLPFSLNPQAHYMKPGTVAFIPGWIMLFIVILTLAVFFPEFFISNKYQNNQPISPLLLAFIIGSLAPAFDDLFAYMFGPPFAHHSLFHSILGVILTLVFFFFLGGSEIAKYAALGNICHIFFNFFLDYTTLFFPYTYREFGLTHLINYTTYQIKIVFYPLILLLFALAVIIAFR